jgi:predicted RNA binding protein YcfA (HicA-like mRNA interferase family)
VTRGRKLTGLNGKQIVRALQRGGFELLRVSGSHHILRKAGLPDSKVIVPVHGAHDLPPGTVRSIIEQSKLTTEEFLSLF